MFTAIGAATKMQFPTAGSASATVPVGATAVRIMTKSAVQLVFASATATPGGMTVMGQANRPATEIFGVTTGDNIAVYGQAGASVELQFGTVLYPAPA